MRVMYIHAGKRINKDLKADEYHVDLFRDKLRLKFEIPSHRNAMQNLFIDSSSSLDSIEKLPRGEILGIAIFNETYWFDRNLHSSDPWKLGPFCYGILDVFRFEKGVKACGQLGIWTPKQDAQNQIAQQISVQNKINEWKHTYGDQLYFGKDPNGIPAAITILQPFVEGILRGIKRVENRKRPFFRLHDNKLLYKHPSTPGQTQCRFCPVDGSKCKYWAHVNDENKSKRIRRDHKKNKLNKSLSQISNTSNSSNSSNTSRDISLETDNEYYDEYNQYKIEYNTRGHKRKIQSFINGDIIINNNNNNNNNNNMKNGNRKRKHSEMNGIINGDTPPQKKHKKIKKKKKKSSRKKKKDFKCKWDNNVDISDKWEHFITDILVGEDGCKPLRMCYHGKIMKPIPNPEDKNKKCDLCSSVITWDHYYKCKCNSISAHYCFEHTRPLRINSTNSWQNINNIIKQLNDTQRIQLIQSFKNYEKLLPQSPTPSNHKKHKKKKKHKSNKVGVDKHKYNNNNNNNNNELDRIVPVDIATATPGNAHAPVANGGGLIPHIQFDPTKMKMAPLKGIKQPQQIQIQSQNNNTFNMSPLKKIPFKLNLDANAIANSINIIQNKNIKNITNNNNKMDFSSFPTVTPTISNGNGHAIHKPTMVFNNTNMQIHNMAKTNAISTTNGQPSMNQMLSLSQILNQNNNNNNVQKVTPVPSPFAPSPSPTNNNNNNNNNTNNNINTNNSNNISSVYALQSLLNKTANANTNINNNNINNNKSFINPNPFGPSCMNTNTNNKKQKQKTNNRQNNIIHKQDTNNNTSQNPTENTNTSTSTINNKPSSPNKQTQQYNNKTTLPPYYGPVIAPSYQTMPHTPMQLQQYSTLLPQNLNGQMVYMVPNQHMAYYQNGMAPFQYAQYQQYAQTQNKNNNIPVPVQQT